MQNTTNLNLPYPEPTDPPDGAAQIQALAEALDTQIHTLRRAGSHATWSRSSEFTMSSDGWVSFTGATMSQHPPTAGYVGDADGLAVPWPGVYLLNAQFKWEGVSTFTRAEVQLRQGSAQQGWAQTASVQVKHEVGTGSEEVTIAGRASMMQAGDKVRLYLDIISSGNVRVSLARVHAAYLGDGLG